MFRTPILAALTLALMSAAAVAQAAANAPPAQLSNTHAIRDRLWRRYGPQAGTSAARPATEPPPQRAQAQRSRDLFCRRDAAARTGYITPGQAAGHEQTNGTIVGTLGGAALGAVIGAAAGNAGAGAAIGAGAGLIAGTAVGADNARRRRAMSSATMPTPIMPAWTKPITARPPMTRRLRLWLSAAVATAIMAAAAARLLRLWPYPYPYYPYYYGPSLSASALASAAVWRLGSWRRFHGGGSMAAAATARTI